ncbi:hypothetical protein, partial [Phycicoccus elongatus]|uniref:hypothetical protein n=1 Tax=Phycicoccus elongatus TaxID=101689 RepID=UPI0037832B13
RWWEIIEKYRVSVFYTAPTAIRTHMKWGESVPADFDLTSLRLLGSVRPGLALGGGGLVEAAEAREEVQQQKP